MQAWSSGDRSDLDLGIIIIVVAENRYRQQNKRVDATLQGMCVRKAGGSGCCKTSTESERDYHINQASLVLRNLVERKHFLEEGSDPHYQMCQREPLNMQCGNHWWS